MSTRRVVFLDLDGVLNSVAWYDTRGPRSSFASHLAYNVDPAALARLNRLCAATGARLVLSTAWRHGWTARQWTAAFAALGGSTRIIGATPDLPYQPRGAEIAAWLVGHRPVAAFVILDDDRDMGGLQPRLVRTDYRVGLTDADVDRAMALLLT